jgi:hypothetical protein
MVAHWTRTHEFMRSNSSEVKIFFPAATMLLFYIIQRIVLRSFVFSENLQPYFTIWWPYCKWRLCRPNLTSLFIRHVGSSDFRVVPNGIKSIQVSSKSVQQFSCWIMRTNSRTDGQTDMTTPNTFTSCTSCKERTSEVQNVSFSTKP